MSSVRLYSIPKVVVHASMSQPMVNRLVFIHAQDACISFNDARVMLQRRWTDTARDRIRRNMSTYLMWEEMAEMAARAEPRDFA